MTQPAQPRMTRQRRVILEELAKMHSHPTADELFERARRRLPRISLGTVYRNLQVLCSCGLIHGFSLQGQPRRFDVEPASHNHIRCVRCGRVDDLPPLPDFGLDWPAEATAGYRILGFHLCFEGLCPDCRKRQPEAE